MSQIPALVGGNALAHGISMFVDHGGTSSKKMHVGGQANSDVAAGTITHTSTAENECSEVNIPANSLVVGSTIRARFVAVAEDSNGSDTLRIQLRLGANTTASSNQLICQNAAVDQADNDFCVGDMIIQIRTTGTGGTAVAWGTLTNSDAAGTMSPLNKYVASFAVNTTVKNYLTVTTLWDASHADNEATTQGFVVDIVNPNT